MKAEKEAVFENLKRMELEMQTLRETTDERVQTAENVAKEKLVARIESFRRGNGTVAEERANLEASVRC